MAIEDLWFYPPPLTLSGASKKNEDILLKFYINTDKRLKRLINEAILKGNQTAYLQKLQAEARKEIVLLETQFAVYSRESSKYAYISGIKQTEQNYKQLKIPFEPIATGTMEFGVIHKDAVKALAENIYKPLSQVSKVIGRNTQDFLKRENFKDSQTLLKSLESFVDSKTLRSLGLDNVKGIIVGDTTWAKAAKTLEKELSKKDIFKIPYYTKDGSLKCMVSTKDYSNLVARTTSAQAFREGNKNSILETFEGNDLVQIVGNSSFPNSPCIPFEGQVLSLEGKTEGFSLIEEAEAEGLFHVNCIHHFAVTGDVLNTYEKHNIDY